MERCDQVTDQEAQEAFEAMDEFYDSQANNRQEVIDKIKELKGDAFVEELEGYLDEEGGNYDFCFVDMPVGTLLDEDFKNMTHVYINQTTDGGMSGDSFAGTICVRVEADKFMFCQYSI